MSLTRQLYELFFLMEFCCRFLSILLFLQFSALYCSAPFSLSDAVWGAIHQLLNIILQLRILVLLLVSTLPYVVKVKNYS
jgi:hypothetical protein